MYIFAMAAFVNGSSPSIREEAGSAFILPGAASVIFAFPKQCSQWNCFAFKFKNLSAKKHYRILLTLNFVIFFNSRTCVAMSKYQVYFLSFSF